MTCQQPQPRHSGAARPRQECYKELPLGHGCCIAVDAKAVAVQGGGGMAGVHAAPPIGELGTTKIGGVFAAQAGPGGRDRQAQQQGTPRWGEGRAHHRYGLRALRPPKGTPHLQRRACEAACPTADSGCRDARGIWLPPSPQGYATIRERLHGRGLSTAWAVAGHRAATQCRIGIVQFTSFRWGDGGSRKARARPQERRRGYGLGSAGNGMGGAFLVHGPFRFHMKALEERGTNRRQWERRWAGPLVPLTQRPACPMTTQRRVRQRRFFTHTTGGAVRSGTTAKHCRPLRKGYACVCWGGGGWQHHILEEGLHGSPGQLP
eukprot:CAMPEP_0174350844 /NCGR_PEP_ID=MMETSP0811_2-20130205/8017_1 /TAXON_ID=73025 ORGANISM="Eutreptiella gymnastica-like, Strain CCMP1594" /NCGR_SAMPLE_ID=MMETSP0811_2 /ASSEMBLY_ACC=CAM_ASM_000667 /LENGTH=319 /DNA_ID=CAMNT_0015479519 /DNA_START=616 /DNA_END=1576 /DNA_ORIENTATION=-